MPKIENLFEFPAVQREMIEDDVRLSRYATAIAQVVEHNDVVVDLGTGTGILAFLAIQAGARKVYAIERANIIEVAKKNAELNGFLDKIEFIKGDSRFINLPEKADCLISEVLGHFALEENMLDAIMDARNRFLSSDGKVIPKSVQLFFAPAYVEHIYDREITAWEKRKAGFDMSAGRELAVNNVYLEKINAKDLVGTGQLAAHIDIANVSNLSVRAQATFAINNKAIINGFTGWFNAELTSDVFINTSPSSADTHWKQCFFPLSRPCEVSSGEFITLDFNSKSMSDDVVYYWGIQVWENETAMHPRYELQHSTSGFINHECLRTFWKLDRQRSSQSPRGILSTIVR